MEEVALPRGRPGSIQSIARHRMAERRHMSANLMGAAGAEADAQQSKSLKGFDGLPVGERRSSNAEPGGHAGALFWDLAL